MLVNTGLGECGARLDLGSVRDPSTHRITAIGEPDRLPLRHHQLAEAAVRADGYLGGTTPRWAGFSGMTWTVRILFFLALSVAAVTLTLPFYMAGTEVAVIEVASR
jgi:hypothetical protein